MICLFTERLNELFECLDATSTEIAKFAGCDRSLISRIKSGNRTPKPSSNSTEKLINGIFMFADDKNVIGKLISAVSCPSDNPTPDEIKRHILLFLYEDYSEQDLQKHARKKAASGAAERKLAYGARLDAVMNIADISNVRLSKMLHIDASTVSRFRKGLRVPKANRQLTNDICNILFERILEFGRLSELLKLASIPPNLSDDMEECYERFCNWLCDFKTEDASSFVENLLDNISSFSADIKTPLPDFDEVAPDKILNAKENIYYGTDGVRTAVIRFLGNAVKTGAKELWLYSDQNMDWMSHDIPFHIKWMTLMSACVRHGIKIRIIHNINRNLDEMNDAINSWMPLYMSGMIKSYYCKKQGESKFSTTIFLCPGMACISSVHVYGCEGEGIYRYDTDEKIIKVEELYYKKLLAMSKPLVRIYQIPKDGDKIDICGNGITTVLNTLSLATMPESLIKSMVKRYGLSESVGNDVLLEWQEKNRIFTDELNHGFVHEIICTAEDELLFSGKIPAEIQSANLTYTPHEYKEHIKNTIAFSDSNPNYRFYALPDTPFTNITIAVSENAVLVTRLLPPQMTFAFSHPAMCEAFSEYVNRLKELNNQDKLTTKRLLERYV